MKKMVSNPSERYYQKIKKPFQKNLVKNIKLFLKKKNKKRDNLVVEDTKTFLNMKKKS